MHSLVTGGAGHIPGIATEDLIRRNAKGTFFDHVPRPHRTHPLDGEGSCA
jgi:UDP-glucose 4-epimerase